MDAVKRNIAKQHACMQEDMTIQKYSLTYGKCASLCGFASLCYLQRNRIFIRRGKRQLYACQADTSPPCQCLQHAILNFITCEQTHLFQLQSSTMRSGLWQHYFKSGSPQFLPYFRTPIPSSLSRATWTHPSQLQPAVGCKHVGDWGYGRAVHETKLKHKGKLLTVISLPSNLPCYTWQDGKCFSTRNWMKA